MKLSEPPDPVFNRGISKTEKDFMSKTYKIEPQNIEQGITNVEGNFMIRNSLFDIRYLPAVIVAGLFLIHSIP